MRRFFTLLGCMLSFALYVSGQVGQGAIQGKLIDKETGEPLPFANVQVEENGNPVGGSTTDFDGKYSIKPLSPGEYTVKASYVGYQTVQMNNVKVSTNVTFLDLKLSSEGGVVLDPVDISEFADPLIKKDDNTQGGKINREQFNRLPTRSVGDATSIVPGTVIGADGQTSIRGSRTSANQTFIDGIKVRGNTNLPRAAVEQVEVISGGIPAEVGDITGGATFVTTRGATTQRFAALEYLTSGFGYMDGETQKTWGLDNQGYNLGALTLGGPLWRKKNEKGVKEDAIMSILFTSEFIHIVDTRPSIIGTYKLKDDKLNEMQTSPYMTPNELGSATALSGTIYRSEYDVFEEDMEIVDTRQNASRQDINLQTNITINTSKNTGLRVGGTFFYRDADSYEPDMALYNFYNNQNRETTNWRAYARFTQRFANPVDDEGNETKSTVRNAYVSLQVDYEQFLQTAQDGDHEDDFFRYNYVGSFHDDKQNYYELDFDEELRQLAYIHRGWESVNYTYERSDINPLLANYTSQYYGLYTKQDGSPLVQDNYDNFNNVATFTVVNGEQPRNVYAMWRAPGYNQATGTDPAYLIINNSQFRLSASGAADLGSHEIKLGFEYEQRVDRFYALVNPGGLWAVGRQTINSHIQQRDTNSREVVYINGIPYVNFERLVVEPGSGELLAQNQSVFDYNMRQALGLDPSGNDFIDFDSYDIDTYKIEYFSANELITNRQATGLSYRGYDYTGQKQSGSPTLDDFFNETNEFGDKTRRIDAFRPIYAAGYIQDKFTFDDLIFRVGVRVDYFDANQPVLKDAYSLFPTVSVAEIGNINEVDVPDNIGSDYVVYVNGNNADRQVLESGDVVVIGYRNPEDDSWYNADGKLVGRANDLTGGSGNPYPLLQNGENTSASVDLNTESFEDYKPQINPMPRISFSFPISDEASFFANYDVLISRPTFGIEFQPTDYLLLGNSSSTIANPNLRPEKTITYELGFKQALNRNSAFGISAFYREMRDQIQLFRYDGAYPVTYRSYRNIDFGTVKGITITYELRRIKNASMSANYTLQFAEGTGSGANSQLQFVRAGRANLRNLTYLDYDRRHNIKLNFDFHYGEGKNYNGPKIAGKDFLSNAGFNIVAIAASGAPFTKWSNTRSQVLSEEGFIEADINGSRLPWSFDLNARIDKRFNIKYGSKAKDNRRIAQLEIYLQALNLLNTQNVTGVWRSSGNPEDDGYLSAARTQTVLETAVNAESYTDHYEARIHNPNFYSIQRRLRLGLVLNF